MGRHDSPAHQRAASALCGEGHGERQNWRGRLGELFDMSACSASDCVDLSERYYVAPHDC